MGMEYSHVCQRCLRFGRTCEETSLPDKHVTVRGESRPICDVPMQHEDLQWVGLRVGHDFSACLSVCGLVP